MTIPDTLPTSVPVDDETIQTIELPVIREERTTLTDILRIGAKKRRVSPRRPPRARTSTEAALPSVIVQPEAFRPIPAAPTTSRDLMPTQKLYRYQLVQSAQLPVLSTTFVLGPRTSGLLLGAFAVVVGVVMLKAMPLLGPLVDALLP